MEGASTAGEEGVGGRGGVSFFNYLLSSLEVRDKKEDCDLSEWLSLFFKYVAIEKKILLVFVEKYP